MNRRRFFSTSALTLGAAGAGAALAGSDAAPADAADPLARRVGFDGPRQAGILEPPPAHASFLALDAVAATTAELGSALRSLSYRARQLATGGPYVTRKRDEIPEDSGILGPDVLPDALTVTIGFGASLFGDRYGLTAPPGLTRMPAFDGDELVDSDSHGDVLVQVRAGHQDTIVHAVRELMRATRGALELRWMVDGFQAAARDDGTQRNLFAFRDGTVNPDTRDGELMNRLLWTRDGGTFAVLRTIRMHVEFWDRIGLLEQENIIGRHRDSGAPLGGRDEHQDPAFAADPDGKRIPLDAHIRLARGKPDEAMLRRPYNFQRGFDAAGSLDQGLLFVTYNQDVERQFATVQQRLSAEPMVDYVTTVGGGYFYLPPGTGGKFGWVGERFFA